MTPRRRRPAREALLIVCEGRETEPRYFELLTRALGLKATVDVEIRGDTGYTDPRGLVDAALKLQRDRAQKARSSTVLVPFDEVWVVFDLEDPSNGRGPAVTPAVQYALSKKLRPVLSRPSFEVWYILHDRPNPPGVQHQRRLRRRPSARAPATTARAARPPTGSQTGRFLMHGPRRPSRTAIAKTSSKTPKPPPSSTSRTPSAPPFIGSSSGSSTCAATTSPGARSASYLDDPARRSASSYRGNGGNRPPSLAPNAAPHDLRAAQERLTARAAPFARPQRSAPRSPRQGAAQRRAGAPRARAGPASPLPRLR
jgi:hypothetical protein